jgi:hypothetical protein
MWLNELYQGWRGRSATDCRARSRPARRAGPRLSLEQLEDRSLPSNFTAATASDLIADINAANAAGGSNTITLVAPTTSPYVLTAVDNTTDVSPNPGGNGLPVIAANDSLTIVGNGDTIARSTAVGTPLLRLLDVAAGASLTLQNLTLQGGYLNWAGGAVHNQGTLDLNGVTVQQNVGIAGGGIWSSGSLTLEGGTVIQNNEARGGDARGGGVYVYGGSVIVTGATFSSNRALGTATLARSGGLPGNGSGGALYVAGGTVSVTGATFSSNAASGTTGGRRWSWLLNQWILLPNGNGEGGAMYVAGGTVNRIGQANSYRCQGADFGENCCNGSFGRVNSPT